MKQSMVLLCLMCMLHMPQANAQYYTYTKTNEVLDFLADTQSLVRIIADSSRKNIVSSWQELPFAWRFYGRPVHRYKISDNGFIVFDNWDCNDSSMNTSLPNPDAPRNAIFAFWDGFYLGPTSNFLSNCVGTNTYGTAPERVHVIHWLLVTPEGYNVSYYNAVSFAIVLYESGGFDIIFTDDDHTPVLTGTIGHQNKEGTVGDMIAGSPQADLPPASSGNNPQHTRYMFTYHAPDVDAFMLYAPIQRTALDRTEVPVGFVLENDGAQTITAFDAHYSVKGGLPIDMRIEGVLLKLYDTIAVQFVESCTVQNPGHFTDIKIWIDNVQTVECGEDAIAVNDTLHCRVWVNNGKTVQRRPLVEDFTSVFCGPCVVGIVKIDSLVEVFGDAVAVACIHTVASDSASNEFGTVIASHETSVNPSIALDRCDTKKKKAITTSDGNWTELVAQRMTVPAQISLSMEASYNEITREASAEITTVSFDYPCPSDYRINVWIIENGVSGTGHGWDQLNSCSGNPQYKDSPFYDLPLRITGYEHKHVMRTSLTGAWGDPYTLPSETGVPSKITYSYTIPERWKSRDISIIAFVSEMREDGTPGEVLNSCTARLHEPVTIHPFQPRTTALGGIYPQPLAGMGFVQLLLAQTCAVEVALYSLQGAKLAVLRSGTLIEGYYSICIDASLLEQGTYFIAATGKEIHEIRPFTVVR